MGGNSWWAVQIAVDQRPGEGWEGGEGVGKGGGGKVGREGGGGAAFEGLTEDQQLTRCRRRLSPRALSPSPPRSLSTSSALPSLYGSQVWFKFVWERGDWLVVVVSGWTLF